RFAVPGLVEGDDPVVGGERPDLMLPVLAVAAPAVQEHQGGIAPAADFADEFQSVVGLDDFLDRRGVRGGAAHRRPEAQADNHRHQPGESGVHGCLRRERRAVLQRAGSGPTAARYAGPHRGQASTAPPRPNDTAPQPGPREGAMNTQKPMSRPRSAAADGSAPAPRRLAATATRGWPQPGRPGTPGCRPPAPGAEPPRPGSARSRPAARRPSGAGPARRTAGRSPPFDTTASPRAAAYAHTARSSAVASPAVKTCSDPGNSAARSAGSRRDRFWSNSRLTRPTPAAGPRRRPGRPGRPRRSARRPGTRARPGP